MDKRLLLASAFGIFFIAGTTGQTFAAKVEKRATKCSIATLEGSYIYWDRVIWTKSSTPRPESCPSMERAGLYSSTHWSLERKELTTKGTYTVTENCSGPMQLETGTINQFYLAPNGNSFKWVRMTGKGAVGGETDRATRGLIVK